MSLDFEQERRVGESPVEEPAPAEADAPVEATRPVSTESEDVGAEGFGRRPILSAAAPGSRSP
jgi:hypothetical protein